MKIRLDLAVLCVLILAMSALVSGTESPMAVSDVLTPITVNFSISKVPILNENADLVCRVVSIDDAPNTTAKIELPEGVQLMAGDISGSWDLKANVPVDLNATVRFTKNGDHRIVASAHRVVDENNSWGDLKALYLTIGVTESMFSPGPTFWSTAAQSQPGNVTIKEEAKAIPINETLPGNTQPALDLPSIELNKTNESRSSIIHGSEIPGSLTVTGKWQYWTQLSDYRPSPDVYDYARQFLVRVIKASDSSFLGEGYTDLSGYFSIPINNPGSDGYQVLLYAYTKYNGLSGTTPELRVVSSGSGGITGLDYVWRWNTPTLTAPDGVVDIGTWHPIANYEACWLQNDLIQAWKYAWSNTPGDAGQGTIIWYSTSTDGTYYNTGGQIHLTGEDAKSADTSIHEYGHNVMWNQYHAWPTTYCPSPHYINRWSHANCGWTEGWADFWPLAVFGNPSYTWASGATLNLETPTWGTTNWDNGEGVEGRVAGALWDILDDQNDGYDRYTLGISRIWSAFNNGGSVVNNFAQWWPIWQSYGYSTVAQYAIYQNTIDYRLPWIAIPGAIASTPTLVANSNEFYLAVRGTDNGIYVRKTTSGSWTTPWEVIPGTTNDDIALAVLDNKLHLVARGPDNGIYHKIKDLGTGTWSSWTTIPGSISSTPVLATTNYGSTTTNTLHLVVRGTDNGIYYRSWTSSSGWSGWQSLPGVTNDIPTIISQGTQTLHVVVRGTDNGIYHNRKTLPSGSWTGWSAIPGATSASPTLSWMPGSPGLIVLAVRSTDNHVYYNVWGSSWTGWSPLPGTTSGKPAGAGFTVGPYSYASIATKDGSSGVYNWYGGWPNWLGFAGGGILSYPSIAARGSGYDTQTGIAVRGTDNGIYFAKR